MNLWVYNALKAFALMTVLIVLIYFLDWLWYKFSVEKGKSIKLE